jgi:hypothetical protein
MESSVHQALASALINILRPLVRILLRNGIAYGTFAELAKKAFVDVAFERFGQPGKVQTASRVSALTGLTRKEVKRLHELNRPDDLGAQERYNRAIRVISGWLNDPRYQDSRGRPDELPLEGEESSFAALVKQYSGDIPTQAMLSTLTESGSVDRLNGKVRLVRHAYIPGKDPVDKLQILGTDVAELITTINHNLTVAAPQLRFQRKVSSDRVDSDTVPELRSIAANRAQALLEDLDRRFAQHEAASDAEAGKGRYISVGIYYYEDEATGEGGS